MSARDSSVTRGTTTSAGANLGLGVVAVSALFACSPPASQNAGDSAAGSSNGGSSAGASGGGGRGGSTSAGSGGSVAQGGGAGSSAGGAAGAVGSGTGGGGAGGSGAGGGAGSSAGGGGAGGAGSSDDIVGKVTVGYQGWFDATGDGSGINPPWWHWTTDRNTPTAGNIAIASWPDMSEITKAYATGFANLNGGGAATLYSDWDASTVDTQIKWMQDAGIDTIALQRFGDFRGTGEQRNVVAANVRAAAEAHGRKFYIMYDISGWNTFQTDLKSDWTDHIVAELHLTDSSAYAKQGGKPVVCIWGLGYTSHPGTPQTTLDVINYFHGLGMYVIGGVGNDWRTADGTRWSQAGFLAVFDVLDAISPWMVGVIGNNAGSDANRAQYNQGDVDYLHARGKHYQPCVLPGSLQEHMRRHGDFMWHQFYNTIQIGADGLYISMYDEYNESNQIAKTTPTQASVPAGSGFVSLDEDGTQCSSDYYLRLTADGGKMLRGDIPLTNTRPTSPM